MTMREMLNIEGIVQNPAGALSVNVLQDMAEDIRVKPWRKVCVATGGNFGFERLPEGQGTRAAVQRLLKVFHPSHAQRRCPARVSGDAGPG